ncbi:LysR substrate-binding domain-containing protein [Maritalea porphyrae]|uniref:LysR substrate-binding domain-containing protein n=1 Tax=Maritalea porphyrae TaxID=880732 RepID=UPI0022B0314E|nr:LysR substrate-binding domain-containing protein [Maritalea porphyrae]MCZ4271411.1 LysR substrate-binding domain-containing protein [Maritalea porphyrae]
MATPLDLDQLQTFAVIADCGSFTEAAKRVFKTQSAVSMQIKRLEERLGTSLLIREGRRVTVTHAGETLYHRARRMLQINADIVDLFSKEDLSGTIHIGIPDDYAVRVLPLLLCSFQQSHPKIQIDVKCQPSEELLVGVRSGKYDMIIFTQGTSQKFGELLRSEPMHWMVGNGSEVHKQTPLPIAAGSKDCCWRLSAEDALNDAGIDYRVAYTSSNATAITSAVNAGLAVGVLCESSITKDMRVLGAADGMPPLPDADIAMLRASNAYGGIYNALAEHIKESLETVIENAA